MSPETLAALLISAGCWVASWRAGRYQARKVDTLTCELAVVRSRTDALVAGLQDTQRYTADLGEHLDRKLRELIESVPVPVTIDDDTEDDL